MTTRTSSSVLLASLLVGALGSSAHAEPLAEADLASVEASVTTTAEGAKPATTKRHHVRLALELAGVFAVGNRWYWRDNGKPNIPDWQLKHDMSAVTTKLGTTGGWRFDGNPFDINALGHPGFGMLTHFLARQNGYTLGESFLVSTVASGAWEVFLELAEYGSLNDMLSTSTAGVPLGETAYQIAHHLRETTYEVRGGVGTENGAAFAVVSTRGSLDRIPTVGDGVFRAGRKVGYELALASDTEGVRGLSGSAKAALVGYYRNRADHSLHLALSSEFGYSNQKERAARPWDLQATVSVGPTLDVQLRRGEVTIDAGADLYLDFAMLRAQAYDAWRTMQPTAMIRNVMQDKAQPYYYGMGASLAPHVDVTYRGLHVGGSIAAMLVGSLDGHDRDQEMMSSDAHMTDRDVRAQTWIGYTHANMSVVLDAAVTQRAGAMGAAHDGTQSRAAMLTFGYRR